MPETVPPLQRRVRDLMLAAVVGMVLQWLAGFLVPPWTEPFPGHGERFAEMVDHPFATRGAFPQRVLWPLGAWLAQRLGVPPTGFSELCSAWLVAVVFWFARRRGAAAVDAALLAAAVAASGAVLVYQRMACLSDPLNLAFLVLQVHFAGRPRVFWPLVLLAALSHESAFFFAPWLVYLRCRNGGTLARELRWLGAMLAVYALVRLPMHGEYGVAYYIENSIWVPWALPAMWALWAFVVLVEFGPLLVPVVRAWRTGELARPDALGGRWGIWLYIAGILPMMLLAYDVMRFATFLVVPMVLGALALLRAPRGRALFAALLAAEIVSYLLLHPVPADQGGKHFTIVSGHIRERLGLLVSRTFADAMEFTWQLLQLDWPIALGGALAAAVILIGGYGAATKNHT